MLTLPLAVKNGRSVVQFIIYSDQIRLKPVKLFLRVIYLIFRGGGGQERMPTKSTVSISARGYFSVFKIRCAVVHSPIITAKIIYGCFYNGELYYMGLIVLILSWRVCLI